jgi:Zn-dependent protease
MFANISPTDLVIVFIAILVSMSIHEAMHAYTSHLLGDTTAKEHGRLTLNPLKHIDILTTVLLPVGLLALGLPPIFIAKPVPFNPERVKYEEFGAALIGIVGPFTNLFLAVLAAGIMRLTGVATGTEMFSVFSIFILVNLSFFVFNMIPFPPLDGSRLLYAFAPEPVQKVLYQIESGGLMSILLFMLILAPILSPVISNIVNSLYLFLLT